MWRAKVCRDRSAHLAQFLMFDLLPWENSTRPRKIASILRQYGEVSYVSLAAAGRTGMQTRPGCRSEDGVDVISVRVPKLDQRRTLRASLRNVISYSVGLFRLLRVSKEQPSDVIFCSSPLLLPWAALLSRWGGVPYVFDGRERPASVRTQASLAAWLARVEPFLYRLCAPGCFGVICAAPTHADEYRTLGFPRAHVLFNVPNFPAVREESASRTDELGPLVVGILGSLYGGRGILELIEGVGIARRNGSNVRCRVAGFGSDEFIAEMLTLARPLSEVGAFEFLGPLPYSQVLDFYEGVDIGAVLYSATDRAQDSLPNKLFECLSAGVGVIASKLEETRLVVESNEVGVCVDVSASAIAEVLTALSGPLRQQVGHFARRARQAADDQFNWTVQRDELERFLAPILPLPSPPTADDADTPPGPGVASG